MALWENVYMYIYRYSVLITMYIIYMMSLYSNRIIYSIYGLGMVHARIIGQYEETYILHIYMAGGKNRFSEVKRETAGENMAKKIF